MDNLHSDPADPASAPVPASPRRAAVRPDQARRDLRRRQRDPAGQRCGHRHRADGRRLRGDELAARRRSPPPARCAQLVHKLRSEPSVVRSHPALVKRLRAFCGNPLLRLAAVGGEHGQVTFQSKTGPKTVAFERGTVESVSGSSVHRRAPDGTTWTWELIASTTMRQAGQHAGTRRSSAAETSSSSRDWRRAASTRPGLSWPASRLAGTAVPSQHRRSPAQRAPGSPALLTAARHLAQAAISPPRPAFRIGLPVTS